MCIKPLLLCLTSVCHYFRAVLLCVTSLFVTYSVGVKELPDFLNLNSSVSFPNGKTISVIIEKHLPLCESCEGFWERDG